MEELKRCPFCGSNEVELRKGMLFNGAVHCNNCTADVVFDAVRLINEDGIYEETPWKEAVTKGWNRRVKEPLVQPERKTGRWILYKGNDKEEYMCSECSAKELNPKMARFCWYCGAKMELEEEEGNE